MAVRGAATGNRPAMLFPSRLAELLGKKIVLDAALLPITFRYSLKELPPGVFFAVL